MKRAMPFIVIAMCLVVALGWYLAWYSPSGSDVETTQQQASALEVQNTELQTKITALNAVADQAPALTARAEELSARIPDDASLDSFIIDANQIAQTVGVEWVSVSPSPLAPGGPAGVGVVGFSIEVRASYDEVRTYMEQLVNGDRLVVIDGVSVQPADNGGAEDGASTSALQVTLEGRMFTSAAALPPPATTAPSSSSTATTAPGATTSGSS